MREGAFKFPWRVSIQMGIVKGGIWIITVWRTSKKTLPVWNEFETRSERNTQETRDTRKVA